MKNCTICQQSLLSKKGSVIASVPLFSETLNKEFCSGFDGQPVVLATLLRTVGIVVVPEILGQNSRSVCIKCARKVVNCHKIFSELKAAFESTPAAVDSVHGGPLRIPIVVQHERSPTGVTPNSKRQKSTDQQSKAAPTAKKSLFEETTTQKYSVINDEICQLMNLPVDVSNLPPIVKVRLY